MALLDPFQDTALLEAVEEDLLNRVVELLERALRARHRDHLPTAPRDLERDRGRVIGDLGIESAHHAADADRSVVGVTDQEVVAGERARLTVEGDHLLAVGGTPDAEAATAEGVEVLSFTWEEFDAAQQARWEDEDTGYEHTSEAIVAVSNDGVTWTVCDADGSTNGYDATQAGGLTVQ